MALTKPVIVYSSALTSGLIPYSSQVSAVIGPMQATLALLTRFTPSSPNNCNRLVTVEELVKGMDAVISAYNPGWTNPELHSDTLKAYSAILEGCKKAGIKRLQIVGGAGSLFIKGVRLLDMGVIEETILPGVKALAQVLYTLQENEKEIDWVFFSPAANIAPGKRTGKFHLGKDDLITDNKGESYISVEDYALAMIDELENPKHHFERFTIGY